MAEELVSKPELPWEERARRAGVRIVDPAVITRENIEALKILNQQIAWERRGRDLERERCLRIVKDTGFMNGGKRTIIGKIESGK